MHYSKLAFTSLSLISFVSADFLIYLGGSNGITGPGADSGTDEVTFFNTPPSCDDAYNAVPLENGNDGTNDASDGGWACDGCSDAVAIKDLVITRFEWFDGVDSEGYNNTVTSREFGHVTLYESGFNDGKFIFDIVPLDGRAEYQFTEAQASCTRPVGPDDPPSYSCGSIEGSDSAVLIFTCVCPWDITINHGTNGKKARAVAEHPRSWDRSA